MNEEKGLEIGRVCRKFNITNSKLLSSANHSMILCLSENYDTGTELNRPRIGLIYKNAMFDLKYLY